MDQQTRLKRLRFRAWHRGVKEADLMLGGFFDARSTRWDAAQIEWFEALMEEQDADIMAWAMGTEPTPGRWQGAMMEDLKTFDYVPISR